MSSVNQTNQRGVGYTLPTVEKYEISCSYRTLLTIFEKARQNLLSNLSLQEDEVSFLKDNNIFLKIANSM